MPVANLKVKEKKDLMLNMDNDLGDEESYTKYIVRKFFKHKFAVIGLIVFSLIVIMALAAPLLAPYSPYEIHDEFGASPSKEHILGTDLVGRDLLSRIIYGCRVSLAVGVGAVAIYVVIGVTLGAIAGYFGKWVDMVIMRLTDIFMSFPYFMVILVIVSILGPSLMNIIIILGLMGWPGIARIVRGSVLSIKEAEYIKASVALGFSSPKIIFQHILPNCFAPILVNATFGVASAILMEASLSFLGMGVQPPTASWGNILTDAQSITVLTTPPWLWIPPGIFILFAVLSINFIGDGLRDAMDPKVLK